VSDFDISKLPEGSSAHTGTPIGWIYVVVNITPSEGRAFHSFTDKRYSFAPFSRNGAVWFMRAESLPEFCEQFGVFSDLKRMAA